MMANNIYNPVQSSVNTVDLNGGVGCIQKIEGVTNKRSWIKESDVVWASLEGGW